MGTTTKPLIRIAGLHYSYEAGTRPPIAALRGIELTFAAGEYAAIVGANGSGKSTLLRHLNALLLPTQGDVWIGDWNTRDRQHLRDIRSTVAMVFQSPESQIVATVVEEDVAFGPENLGLPATELRRRVDWALQATGLVEERLRGSHLLSVGQQQRLAIAAALAMQPHCLVLDEATAMLDPAGRSQVLAILNRLHQAGVTIITATNDMNEAALAQRIVTLSEGRLVLQGSPREVFANHDGLRAVGLDLPAAGQMARMLSRQVPGFGCDALTMTELVDDIAARVGMVE